MSIRHHIEVEAELVERIGFKYGIPIERSADEQRMYVVLEGITFWAPSLNEVCS